MAKTEEIAAFLDKSHIFRRMDDEMLFTIAEYFKEVSYKAGETIVGRDVQSPKFYMIYQGKVRLHRDEQGQKDVLFSRGDYFGAEALLPKEKSHSEIIAEGDVTLLALLPEDFGALNKIIPFLKENLNVSVYGRRLIKKLHFDWVREDEVIYFLGRKHPILLFQALVMPILIALFSLFALLFVNWTEVNTAFFYVITVIGVILFIWILWRLEDWRNDYYIVTNQRVVWLEKIIGIHDSRQEAPLTEVLSVGADVGFWEPVFHYGNVNVRTYVGNIHLHHVYHPYQVRHVIEEMWKRAQIIENRIEKEDLKKAILERIHDPDPIEVKKKKESEKKKTWRERLFPKKERRGLKLRYEEGNTIIYRKHWALLVKHAILPGVATTALLGFLAYKAFSVFVQDKSLTTFTFLLFVSLILIFGLWAIYQYMDWSNDTFQVTEDKIFDIDRKPFGNVQSRSAPLENILSIRYERKGIIGYLLNYGTVYIQIGSDDFVFEDVRDPGAVQHDLDNRRMARITKEKQAKQKKERDRMVDWIFAYHQSRGELGEYLDESEEQEEQESPDGNIDIY